MGRPTRAQYPDLTDKEKALEIVKDSVGAIFARVLEDAGVYKQTEQGQTAFMRFVEQVEFCQTRSFLLAQSYKKVVS